MRKPMKNMKLAVAEPAATDNTTWYNKWNTNDMSGKGLLIKPQ